MHYVMSDIHGDSAALDAILAMIDMKGEDQLYILGDVVDRGPDGIALLRRIRGMPNATLLLGNHECMMIDALRHPDDNWALMQWWQNGCEETFRRFYDLAPDDREDLLGYVESLPVQLEVCAGERRYCLVHAAPVELHEADGKEGETEFAVWHRMPLILPPQLAGRTIVIGHTPSAYWLQTDWPRMRIAHGNGVIDLDCGCAYPKSGGQLGCLRLEDMTEFYSIDGVVTARAAAEWRALHVKR